MKGHDLRDYLGDDYCAQCDAFLVEQNERGTWWCPVCWETPLRLSKRLRDLITAATS